MSSETIFETCSKQFDSSSDLSGFLQCISETAEASVASQVGEVSAGLNAFWLIFAGALVFFMQVGFAMLLAGSIRAKNVKNVVLWNLLDSSGGGIAFWCIGFALAFGGDTPGGSKTFVGNNNFFLRGDIPRYEFWFYQFAFAAALSSIVAGTIAERTQMKAYLLYSFFLCGFVYPVVAHAYWSYNGWLSVFAADPLFGSGAIDLAGSGPVHMCGGVAAFVAGLILGPRRGRFYDEDGNPLDEPKEMPPHSVSLQMLGTLGLWFGWYGFNPGSTLAINTQVIGQVAALVAVNTTLSACAAGLSAMFTSTFIDWYYYGVSTWDVGYTMNGALTGLVAITAPAATVDTWSAVVIGIVAGWTYLFASKLLVYFRYDDPVDAVPVHMFGGMWGVIAPGLFTQGQLRVNAGFGSADNVGWFYEWSEGSADFSLLGAQLVGLIFTFSWTFIIMGTFFMILRYFNSFRVDPLEEEVGLDISRHKGSAYDISRAEGEMVDQFSKHRQEILANSRHGSKKIKMVEDGVEAEGYQEEDKA